MQTIVLIAAGHAGGQPDEDGMTEEADALQLGWLGTGRMGAAMVRRLLARGCDVSVYNRTAAKAVPLSSLARRRWGRYPT